jgi:predicted NAD/FAD-binding protein|tara:strand:- start:4034 stop:5284 length:1251 start_codon:yes stop_codon:yes gene_type:complete
MKIAIIGTGISGLTTAYLLNKKHAVTVFEKNDYVGGHTHTHNINLNNKNYAVDSGFICYNENTYPNFIKLLKILGVESQKTTMGFSVKSKKKKLEYAGNSLNSLFSQRKNIFSISFLWMIRDILLFNKNAKKDLATISSKITLGEYLKNNNYSKAFIYNYIVPMGAAIWSTKATSMLDISALFFIRFFDNHGLLQINNRPNWWVIKGGSKEYVKKLVSSFKENIRLSSPVYSINRTDEKIEIKLSSDNAQIETFDAVVIATHSDQALKLLSDKTSLEEEILSALPYQKNEALLHTDHSVLPKNKLAWASWNYNLDQEPEAPIALTYNMNILQSFNATETFCVTLNSNGLINPTKVIKKLKYDHPLFTVKGIAAQKRKNEISGVNNTYFCGAYWRNGFHEDGVVSALDVAKQFGISL